MPIVAKIIWFLIIANPNGGLLSIPQANQAQCFAQAQHLNSYFRPLDNGTDAFCVYGKE